MGFKFRKRIKIAPGISINIGKSGITSATVGKRGASLNIGKNGVKATAGIPGSGLSYTTGNLLPGQKETSSKPSDSESGETPERLGFFANSTQFGNDPNETPTPPPLTLVLTNKQFRKLSIEEKKAFKDAGGKVRLSTSEKIFLIVVIVIALGWLSQKHSAEGNKPEVTQLASGQTNK